VRSQRIVFTAYLVVILAGLVYFAALGVAHR
jgi:hypothetical protein